MDGGSAGIAGAKPAMRHTVSGNGSHFMPLTVKGQQWVFMYYETVLMLVNVLKNSR